MKNWEKYEKEIKEVGIHRFAVSKDTKEIVKCQEISCKDCLIKNMANYSVEDCSLRTNWLYSDYKEPVVPTDDERQLCKLLGDGWIARDLDGSIYHYHTKPKRGRNMWVDGMGGITDISCAFPQCKFKFIKWEDEEPWEVRV